MARLGDRLFAAAYARLVAGESAPMRAWRQWVAGRAHGVVVELGAGTGANLEWYRDIDRLLLVEPSPAMRSRLGPAAAAYRAEVIDATAEALPLEDASVDAVVATLVLCSVPDLPAALAEIRRVLRPDGRLLLIEHVRARESGTAAWQDRIDPVWCQLAQGCHPNRDTAAAVADAGFTIVERHPVPIDMPGGRFFPHVAIDARV